MNLRTLLCFHQVKEEVIVDRQIVFIRLCIHEIQHLVLDADLPIRIVNARPIGGHFFRKSRQFLRKNRLCTSLHDTVDKIGHLRKWGKPCIQRCRAQFTEKRNTLLRIMREDHRIMPLGKNKELHCAIITPRCIIDAV